jgi:DNA (cytosine-5)-methyltransferase 1
MNHGSLFSGIGGFDLAAEWMGWNNVFHCEWNPFGQQVLKYHFPKSISYHDITKTDFSIHRGEIDILTGGFPCQPYSSAGKRLGKDDERHLFPEMLRAIKEIKPRWIVGENVRGLVSWNEGLVFNEVYDDLEREGYEVQSFLIPACAKNAPHRRDRIWFVAYSKSIGLEHKVSKQKLVREIGLGECIEWNFQTKESLKSGLCWANDGISKELDGITFSKWRKESVKAYGNAIVPQIAHQIFKTIQEFEELV